MEGRERKDEQLEKEGVIKGEKIGRKKGRHEDEEKDYGRKRKNYLVQ